MLLTSNSVPSPSVFSKFHREEHTNFKDADGGSFKTAFTNGPAKPQSWPLRRAQRGNYTAPQGPTQTAPQGHTPGTPQSPTKKLRGSARPNANGPARPHPWRLRKAQQRNFHNLTFFQKFRRTSEEAQTVSMLKKTMNLCCWLRFTHMLRPTSD